MNFNINGHNVFIIVAVTFLASLIFIYISKQIAQYIGAMDIPNERSAHKKPTPLLGGVGIFFSFLTFFLPIMTAYSQEIRMYSWAFLIITVTSIYAYRFYRNVKDKNDTGKMKNLVIFCIFSICACYIHYYALITTCLINLLLLIFLIRNRKEAKIDLRNFLILAGIQVLIYIPWLVFLLRTNNACS